MKEIAIKLAGKSFTWPKLPAKTDTVLLKLKLKKRYCKIFARSTFEVCTKTKKISQCLPKKNQYSCYLNVTNLLDDLSVNDKVFLKSNKFLWEQDAKLLCFQNKLNNKANSLIIAPHADDAEMAAFGFYSSNKNSHIVTITAGEGGDTKCTSPKLKAKLRIVDSIAVPMLGDVTPEHCVNLGYFDGTLKDMYLKQTTPVASQYTVVSNINEFRKYNVAKLLPKHSGSATWENLVKDLVAIIKKTQPETIVLPHPLLDRHLDHKFTALAVFEAVQKAKLTTGKFLFYVLHPELSHKYPYGGFLDVMTVPISDFDMDVYSYSLSAEQQEQKKFALDAMHDLRYSPDHVCKISTAISQQLNRLLGRERHISSWHNYFLKTVRPNELFLVLPYDKLPNLLREFDARNK